jgi:hypothetical protein
MLMQICEHVSHLIEGVDFLSEELLEFLPASGDFFVEDLILWDLFLHLLQEYLVLLRQRWGHCALEILVFREIRKLLQWFRLDKKWSTAFFNLENDALSVMLRKPYTYLSLNIYLLATRSFRKYSSIRIRLKMCLWVFLEAFFYGIGGRI